MIDRPLIIQNLTLQPGDEWSPQFAGWTVVCVLEGFGYCLHKKDAHELRADDGFTAPHFAQIKIRASQLGPLLLRHFQVQPDLLNGLLTIAECRQLKALRDDSPCIYFFDGEKSDGQKLLQLTEQPETLAMRCALLQLWADGITDLFDQPAGKLAGEKLEERFTRLVEQLPEAELLNASSFNLAVQLDCSERHFRRLFRRKFGESFHDHQVGLRLQRACELLSQSATKISDIAQEIGYPQDRLFSAAFKKRFGTTPGEWRKQHFASSNGHAKLAEEN